MEVSAAPCREPCAEEQEASSKVWEASPLVIASSKRRPQGGERIHNEHRGEDSKGPLQRAPWRYRSDEAPRRIQAFCVRGVPGAMGSDELAPFKEERAGISRVGMLQEGLRLWPNVGAEMSEPKLG
ncbi:unnamed protein product [Gadus morhua 'NCC']